jgi:hypothetical protein
MIFGDRVAKMKLVEQLTLGHSSDGPSWIDLAENRVTTTESRFSRLSQLTFATWGNSGIEPDKGEGISSPGTYEANLMWPRNDGERQWNTMSDWTCH